MELKRVVVTGLGALTPLGNTVPEYWNALLAGTSGANLITRFDATKLKTKFACELKGFSVEEHIERKEARKMDAFLIMGLQQLLRQLKILELMVISLTKTE